MHVLSSNGAELDLVRSYDTLASLSMICLCLRSREEDTNLDIYVGNITDHIQLVVNDSQRSQAFIIHQLESFFEWLVSTARQSIIGEGSGFETWHLHT